MIFSSHDLDSKIFVTNEIKQVDKIVKNFKNSKDYVYCAIGGDDGIKFLNKCLIKE